MESFGQVPEDVRRTLPKMDRYDPAAEAREEQKVKETEDDMSFDLKGLSLNKMPQQTPPEKKNQGRVPPPRPGHGPSNLNFLANYFPVKFNDDIDSVYSYDFKVELKKQVTGNPQAGKTSARIPPTSEPSASNPAATRPTGAQPANQPPAGPTGKKLGRIIELYLAELPPGIPRDVVLGTDFRKTVVLKIKVPNANLKRDVTYFDEGDTPRDKAQVFTVEAELKHVLSVKAVLGYLSCKGRDDDLQQQKLQLIHILNIILNYYAKSHADRFTSIGALKLFVTRMTSSHQLDSHDLTEGLVGRRGFFTSVRPATNRFLVNINTTHAAFYNSKPPVSQSSMRLEDVGLKDFIRDLKVQDGRNFKRNIWKSDDNTIARASDWVILNSILAGLRIKTTHMGYLKIETIRGLHNARFPKSVMFGLKETSGKGSTAKVTVTNLSVFDYFKQRYPQVVIDHRYPVVVAGSENKPVYLPVEVCKVLPWQPARKTLEGSPEEAMIKFSSAIPETNVNAILNVGVTAIAQSDLFKIGAKLVTVRGSKLSAPGVLYNSFKTKPNSAALRVSDGSWNLRGDKFFSPCSSGQGKRWVIITLRREWGQDQERWVNDIATVFQAKLTALGLQAGTPFVKRQNLNVDIDKLDSRLEDADRPQCSFALIIIPRKGYAGYSQIKALADKRYGVQTVCCARDKLSNEKGRHSYLGNVALKLNLKLGGENHRLGSKAIRDNIGEETMIVGIDVTHPPPGSLSTVPSIAAMVASTDGSLSQWPGVACRQPTSRQEIVAGVHPMLAERLRLWHLRNGKYPEKIIVYRDGVSEGQYQDVLDKELPGLESACMAVMEKIPPMTLVVVGKRHHTRFYQQGSGVEAAHTSPGTVVDRGITEARQWDFFLQSHATLQGTARPAHYVVLHDSIFTARAEKNASLNIAQELQQLTHDLCHAFGRATKAVSYCPPAYYADILCGRAKLYYTPPPPPPPPASAPSESTGNTQAQDEKPQPLRVHPKLQNTMYYI